MTQASAAYVWFKQRKHSVVVIRNRGRGIAVKLWPFASDNRAWLKSLRAIARDPKWISDEQFWLLPRAAFEKTVDAILHRYGSVYVIQKYNKQEKCAPACLNAQGYECTCSCAGVNHGAGNDGNWFEVSEAFATRWREEPVSCKLLTTKEREP